MKKIIAMILSLTMVLAIAATMGITVSAAPEGEAINSEADFLAMKPDGKYYLNADITLNSFYEEEFTGTFDGNGKTVTLKASGMFLLVYDATIGNFTVNGDINMAADDMGFPVGSQDFCSSVCILANGKTLFHDIVSNLNFTAAGEVTRYGTIAATSDSDYDITIKNCVNNGNIKTVSYAGGIYGWNAKVGYMTIDNCVNNGDVYMEKGYGAGILCRASTQNINGTTIEITNCINNGDIYGTYGAGITAYGQTCITITGCINTGDITGYESSTGGILANYGNPGDNIGSYIVHNNINYGNVKSTFIPEEGKDGANVGGIVGYFYGKGGGEVYADVQNNINFGTVESVFGWYTSQIMAYTNSNLTTICNNIGAGKIICPDTNKACLVGLSSADVTLYTIKNNYYLENDGTTYFTHAKSDSNSANRFPLENRPEGSLIFTTPVALANGEVVNALNTAIGSNVFEVKDNQINLVCQHGYYSKATTPEKAPTCTEAGNTAAYKCDLCGTDVASTVIESLGGHDLDEGICKRCDYIDHSQTVIEETKAPEVDTTKAPEAEQTPASTEAATPNTTKPAEEKGCGGFVAGAVAIVAILGTAVAFKKKED